ncbi:hypothetical protein FRC01_008936, partial [Tulasnella sp. 417]
MELDVPSAPQQGPRRSLTSTATESGHTPSGMLQGREARNPIQENASVVARERLKRLQGRSKAIPVIGRYIGAIAQVGLDLAEIVQHMDKSKDAAKTLESSLWKLATLVQYVEERLDQHKDDIPNLVGDIQRELKCIHGKIKELRSPELLRDAFVSRDQAHLTGWQGAIWKVSEVVQLLVDLNMAYLLTEL